MRSLTCLFALGTALSVSFAAGRAVQPEPNGKAMTKQPAWATTPEYTAFPELQIKTMEDYKNLVGRMEKEIPRKIPENGTAVEKIKTAQFNEGIAYLLRFRILIETGAYRPEEYREFLSMANDVFRVAAELEPTDAKKLKWHEMRVQNMSDGERFVSMRVKSGTDPVRQLNLARYARLQAEAELAELKERISKAKP